VCNCILITYDKVSVKTKVMIVQVFDRVVRVVRVVR
jgi:hypothetical protein